MCWTRLVTQYCTEIRHLAETWQTKNGSNSSFQWQKIGYSLCLKWNLVMSWFFKTMASTLLEGSNYVLVASVITCLLTLKEHLDDPSQKFKKFKTLCEQLEKELVRRFSYILNPSDEKFDQTYWITSVLHSQKSTELTETLFEEGKCRLQKYVLSSMRDYQELFITEMTMAPSEIPTSTTYSWKWNLYKWRNNMTSRYTPESWYYNIRLVKYCIWVLIYFCLF